MRERRRMSKRIGTNEGKQAITRVCYNCGKTIKEDDLWYPFFNMARCGGGILYVCAPCAVERIIDVAGKEDLLERVSHAEREKDDPLSDGLINFYWYFPISPVHWVRFYALGDDLQEIRRLLSEEEKREARPKREGRE